MSNEVKAQNTIDLTSLKDLSDTVEKTDQYFWHTETGQDAGAHITEVPKDDFISNPEGGNTLLSSLGMKIRKGLATIAEFGTARIRLGVNKLSSIIELCDNAGQISASQKYGNLSDYIGVARTPFAEGSLSRNGLTFTVTGDYVQDITITGTATADTKYIVVEGFEANSNFYQFDFVGAVSDEIYLGLEYEGEMRELVDLEDMETLIFSGSDYQVANLCLFIKDGVTISNVVERGMYLEEYGTAETIQKQFKISTSTDTLNYSDKSVASFASELKDGSGVVTKDAKLEAYVDATGSAYVVMRVEDLLNGTNSLASLNDGTMLFTLHGTEIMFRDAEWPHAIDVRSESGQSYGLAFFGSAGRAAMLKTVHDNGIEVRFGVGDGGSNHGIYSASASKWIAHADDDGIVYVDGKRMDTHSPTISISASTGILDYSEVKRYGNVVQLYIRVRNSSSVAAGGNVFTGTINTTGLRPLTDVKGVAYYGGQSFAADLAPSGAITVRNTSGSSLAPISSGSGVSPTFTYLVS